MNYALTGLIHKMNTDIIFQQIVMVLRISGNSLITLAPYVAGGVILGELLKLTSWTKLLYRAGTKHQSLTILSSVILAVSSPLCTFGTVPVAIQLFRSGIPLAVIISFLAASSLMNPQLFMITWGGISPGMASARLLSVIVFGLLTGCVIKLIPEGKIVKEAMLAKDLKAEEILSRPKKEFNIKKISADIWRSFQFVSYYMLAGILAGAVIEVFVPGKIILALFKPGEWYSVLAAGLLGIPLYACGGGTIPMIQSLLNSGMSSGAALAFFIIGPATRPAPIAALASFLKPKFIAAYILLLTVYSVIIGIIYH